MNVMVHVQDNIVALGSELGNVLILDLWLGA